MLGCVGDADPAEDRCQVRFDRGLGDFEVVRDLFIERAIRKRRQHAQLARRQRADLIGERAAIIRILRQETRLGRLRCSASSARSRLDEQSFQIANTCHMRAPSARIGSSPRSGRRTVIAQ